MTYQKTYAERRAEAIAAKERREQRYAAVKQAAAYKQYQRLYDEQQKREEEERRRQEEIESAGVFERNWQSALDFGANVVTGFVKGMEGIVDFGATVVGGVGGLIDDGFQDGVKDWVARDLVGEWFGNAWQEKLDKSYLNDMRGGDVVEGVASGIGQMLPAVIISVATGGAGAPAAVSQALSLAELGVSAAGTSTEEAFKEGADYGEGMLYGTLSGGVEVGTELMWGGFGKLYGKGLLDNVGKSVARTGVRRIAREAFEEGTEEVVSELFQPALKSIYKGADSWKEYGDADYWKGVGKAGVIGAATSLTYGGTIGAAITTAKGQNLDVDAVLENVEKIDGVREKQFEKGTLTADKVNEQNKTKLTDYEKLEKVLKKKSADTRDRLMKNYGLETLFEADGSLKTDVRETLNKPVEKVNQSLSLGLQGQEERIGEILSKEGTKIYEGELTAEEQKQYQAFKEAHRALAGKSLVGTEYVLVDTMTSDNAFLAGDVIALGKDQLQNSEAWAGALSHEVTHFAEGSDAYYDFVDFIVKNTDEGSFDELVKKTAEEYFDGDEAAEVREGFREAIQNDNLTESQEKLLSEVIARKSEEIFGSEKMIRQLTKKKPGFVRRMLQRIRKAIRAIGESAEMKAAREYLEGIERNFEEALKSAGETYNLAKAMGKGEKDNNRITRYSVKEAMTEEQRAQELKKLTVTAAVDTESASYDQVEKLENSQNYAKKEIRDTIAELADELGILSTDFSQKDIPIEFQFAKGNGFKKSIHEIEKNSGNYANFAKALINIRSIIEGSELIYKSNTDIYADTQRANPNFESKNVLLGAFESGTSLIPVKFEILTQHGVEKGNLYVLVSMTEIENGTSVLDRAVNLPEGEGLTRPDTDSIYSISQIVEKINPKDKFFLKYIPDELLNKEQIKAKEEAIQEDNKRIIKMREEKRQSDLKRREKKKVQHSRKSPLISPEGKKMSQAQTDKAIANATREKVYSREDVHKIVQTAVGKLGLQETDTGIMILGELRGKGLTTVEDELYRKINTIDKGKAGALALDFADLVITAATVADVMEDSAFEESRRIVNELKRYFRRIDLSEIKGDINQRYDKESKRVFARWGARKGVPGTVTADMAARELEELGVRVESNAGNEAELLLEMNRMLDSALDDLKTGAKTKMKDVLKQEDHKNLRQMIAKQFLDDLAKGGKPSDFSKYTDAKYWAEQTKIARDLNAAKKDLEYEIDKLRDFKLGTFFNATEFRGDNFEKSVNRLVRIFNKGQLSDSAARQELKQFRAWYSPKNEMLGTEYYNGDLADMMDEILLGDPEDPLTAREVGLLTNIVRGVRKFAETYNKVWKNGQWQDLDEVAPLYVERMKFAAENEVGWIRAIRNSRYFEEFSDPMTIARMMDGYDPNGFFTEQMENLRYAAVAASVEEMDVLKEYREFLEKHKKYLKRIENERVEYRGMKILRSEAMLAYMSFKRRQAWEGLLFNGFKYTGEDGKRLNAPGTVSAGKYSLDELQGWTVQEQKALKTLFSAEDLKYIEILEKGYEAAKKMKIREDMRRFGYTNAEEGYYVPIKRADTAQDVNQTELSQEYNRVSNASFNKDTVQGAAQALDITSADRVFRTHIKAVSMYANLSAAFDEFNRVFNHAVNGNLNKPVSVKTVAENHWKNGFSYFTKLIGDLQGIRPTKDGSGIVNFFRGSYAKYQLGLNPKTWVTQMSSFFAGSSLLDVTSIMRGMTISGKDVDTYCRLAELRNTDDTAYAAQAVMSNAAVEKMNGFSAALMKPIGVMDRFVVTRLFGACQVQIEKNGGAKIGTVENKKAAGELLTKVILETQQNSISTERSAAMRSGSEFKKAITMFTADSMKVIGRCIDGIGEAATLHKALKTAKGEAREALEARMKTAKVNARKSIAALVGSAVFMALIAKLFSKLYGKKEDEEPVKTFALDAVGNLIGGLPLIKDVYAYFAQGYDLSNYAYGTINDMLSTAKDVFETAGQIFDGEATDKDIAKLVRNLLYTGGAIAGIPTRNAQNIVHGIMTYLTPELAYKYDALLYNKNLSKDLNAAIEKGDDERANTIIDVMLHEKSADVKDGKVKDVLYALTKAGYSVLPRSVGNTVTYNGEEISLTKKQTERFRTVYNASSAAVEDLVKLQRFKDADEETQARAVKWIWDTYYNLALSEVVGEGIENKNVLFAEAIDIEKLAMVAASAKSITADLDRKGNAVSGSRKRKIERYIEGLKLSAAQKYMLMGYLGYKNANGEKAVREYISRLRLTAEEKKLLLGYSGY